MYKIILSILTVSVLISCEQKTIGDKTEVSKIEEPTNEVAENQSSEVSSGERKMIEIETIPLEMLTEKKSLRYEKIDLGVVKQITAFYKGTELVKIVEDYRLGQNKNAGLKAYYFENGNEPVAIVDSYEDWRDTSLVVFSEKRTFYEKGKAVKTDFRTADYYELINDESFKKIRTESFDTEEVFQMLEGKGVFKTYFIGVIETPAHPYLLVGEPNKTNGYQSTLRVPAPDAFINDLLQNQDKYLNKPVKLEFEEINEKNFVFTVYKSGEWI